MLNNKQKKYLRAEANHLRPLFQLGKDGIGFHFIKSLDDALEVHELVKINLLKTAPISTNEAAIECASQTNSEIVQTIGKTMIFYRKNKNTRFQLPK